jgi:hypothetical protein
MKSRWQVTCGFQKGNMREVWAERNDGILLPDEMENSEVNKDKLKDNVSDVEEIELTSENEHGEENIQRDEQINDIDVVQKPESDQDNIKINETPIKTTRAGRQVRRPAYLNDYIVYESNIEADESNVFTDNQDQITLMLTGNQENFYYHVILREPDVKDFMKAMEIEINDHNQNRNWISILRSTLPPNTKVLPSVWVMRCKRRLTDGTIYKWKTRLNVAGSKQVKGVNYWET